MDSIELTKQLIAIPSFVDGSTDEKELVEFLVQYLEKKLPWFTITLQTVEDGRANIFLKDNGETRILVVDQIDTVRAATGWETEPCVPIEKNERIYGLGASDSKGNVAALLKALEGIGPTSGLAVLFYVDEEYAFKGMKKFVASDLAKTISPESVLSIDGNGLVIGRGCRGLIEIDLLIKTASGHSANPSSIGAIDQGVRLVEELRTWLREMNDEFLGSPTLNIGGIQGGFVTQESKEGSVVDFVGNQIANISKMKIEIRAIPGVRAKDVVERMQIFADEVGANIETTVLYDLASFSTPREYTKVLQKACKDILGNVSYLNPSTFGYLDLAMLQEVYENANLYSFGIGEPGVNHKANEYIPTKNLKQGERIYESFLRSLLG